MTGPRQPAPTLAPISRRFLWGFIPALLLVLAFGGWSAYLLSQTLMNRTRDEQSAVVSIRTSILENELNGFLEKLEGIAADPELALALNDPSVANRGRLETSFQTLLLRNRQFSKVRWIDEHGQEQVRAKALNGQILPTHAGSLLDSSNRYYFAATLRLPPGRIHVSPIELSQEDGPAEQPPQPTLRFAKSVRDAGGQPRGIVVISVNAARWLNQAPREHFTGSQLMLIDPEGRWVQAPNLQNGGLLADETFASRYPDVWQAMARADVGWFTNDQGLWSFGTVDPRAGDLGTLVDIAPRWRLVARLPASALTGLHLQVAWSIGPIVLAAVAIAGLLLWRQARRRALLQVQGIQLRRSEARHRDLFESSTDGIFIFDQERLIDINPAGLSMLGARDPADVLGKTPAELSAPQQPNGETAEAGVRRVIDATLAEGRQQFEWLVRRVDNRKCFLADVRMNRLTADDRPTVCASIRDISQQRAVEQSRQEVLDRLQNIAGRVPGVVYEYLLRPDGTSCFPYASEAMGMIYQVEPEAVRKDAAKVFERLHPEDYDRVAASIAASARNLTPWGLEYRVILPDGAVRWLEGNSVPQRQPDGSTLWHGFIHDITERKRMSLALEQASQAAEAAARTKSEFLANMSHEIRTPMNVVLGLAQLLERESLTPDQHDIVTRIRTAGRSLLGIINDILDFSKIEAGQLRVERQPFQLGGILFQIESLMSVMARNKRIDLRIEAPATLEDDLLGDALRIEQVLINLIGNALKFTERGAVVLRVILQQQDQGSVRLRFEVRDTGIGMAPDRIARLFTPFTQADSGITRRFGGTGLGLSISKSLIEAMGGMIGVDSTAGLGSTFWFELPFERATGTGVPAKRPVARVPVASGEPRLTGLHLLVVDDSPMNRDVVERALKREGARATLAADGQQALQYLHLHHPGFAAVLMDVQMPVMDGLTAMAAIRRNPALADLPLIAFTAGVLEEQRKAALEAGANDFLPKPIDIEEMVAVVLRWTASSVEPLPDTLLPAPPTSAEGLPAIPGIDAASAEQTLGNDRTFFLELLQRFINEFGDAGDTTRAELATGQWETAAQRLHTLRSNAGNIGAMAVFNTAQALESILLAPSGPPDAALDAFCGALDALVAACQPWLTARDERQ